MSLILRPCLVYLDTSTLGEFARRHAEQGRRIDQTLRQFYYQTERFSYVPAFSSHSFLELLQHENAEVVHQRIQFLRSIPQVAALKVFGSDTDFLGTVFDQIARELVAKSDHHEIDATCQIASIRGQTWQIDSGKEVFCAAEAQAASIRESLAKNAQQEKELISIAAMNWPELDQYSISDCRGLAKGELNSLTGVDEIALRVREEIEVRGDRRLNNPDETTRWFSNAMTQFLEEAERTGSPIDFLLGILGVDPSGLNPNMKVSDAINVGLARRVLSISVEKLDSRPKIVDTLDPCELSPSLKVLMGLRKIQRTQARVNKSDFVDAYSAPLGLYCEICEADRRTREFVRQLCRNEEFDFMRSVKYLGNAEILQTLRGD